MALIASHSRTRTQIVATCIAVAAAVAFIGGSWSRAGALSLPVDDAYIYLQYAKRLATGHGFEYTDGNGPSTGATSYLYTFLLAPGWWLGLQGRWFALWALAIGTACFAATLCLAKRLAETWSPAPTARAAGWTALLFTAANGFVLWGAFSGMEVPLQAMMLLLCLAWIARDGAAPGRAWIACALLGWVRPEGVFLGGGALAVLAGVWMRRGGNRSARTVATAAAAAALLAGPTMMNIALTGSYKTDGYVAKSIMAVPPELGRDRMIEELPSRWLGYARDVVTDHLRPVVDFDEPTLLGGAEPWIVGAAAVAGFAAAWIASATGAAGVAGALAPPWIAAAVLLVGASRFSVPRYFIALLPLFWVLAACGWARIAARAAGGARMLIFFGFAAAAAAGTIPHAAAMWRSYGWCCENTENQQSKIGLWLRDHTAPGTRVAVNDAGAIAYYSERPILDLFGLVSHGWAAAMNHNPGAIFEKLDALPAAARPGIFAYYPTWYPELSRTSTIGELIASAKLEHNVTNGSDVKEVRRAEWRRDVDRRVPRSAEFARGEWGAVVDFINIADLDSEAAHAFAARGYAPTTLQELPLHGAAGPPFADGGRVILGTLSCRARYDASRPARLALRTRSESAPLVHVEVGGRLLEPLRLSALPGEWQEYCLSIPAGGAGDGATVEVSALGERGGAEAFELYDLWLLQ